MEFHGVVRDGIIVLDDAAKLSDGTRVRVIPLKSPKPFGQRFAQFKGTASDLPNDLAAQHDHYRLGTPKRPE